MMWLVRMFRTPSSFQDDPLGYLRNQAGHAYLVGGLPVLVGFPWWLVIFAYAAWEFGQWQFYRAEVNDCLEDIAHVALIATAALYQIPLLIAVHGLWLGAGYYKRKGW
jgi:hypothetical protein